MSCIYSANQKGISTNVLPGLPINSTLHSSNFLLISCSLLLAQTRPPRYSVPCPQYTIAAIRERLKIEVFRRTLPRKYHMSDRPPHEEVLRAMERGVSLRAINRWLSDGEDQLTNEADGTDETDSEAEDDEVTSSDEDE